jgi:uncharacterized membrane protein
MANTLMAQSRLVDQQNTSFAQALSRIEATAQKQIEQVLTLAQTTSAASNSKHNDLKDRVALIEGRSAGIGSTWGVLIGVLGFLGMVAGLAVAILKS